MAAVGLSQADTSLYLIRGVSIACENSPNSTTISGDEARVLLFFESFKKEATRSLRPSFKPWHSLSLRNAFSVRVLGLSG